MKQPNFFILGAPKCGTTSMAEWLAGHPAIFMCPVKSPTFFCTDILATRKRRLAEYEKLFEAAEAAHTIVGEASTDYLFSQDAVPNILAYSDSPKFLVMIRNPIEMAYALYGECYYEGDEHIPTFEQAWHLQYKRARGEAVGRLCREPKFLLYGPYCRLGEQLERLYAQVPQESVLVILLEDVAEAPRREYLNVLDFLRLQDDGRSEYPVLNKAKKRRLRGLTTVIRTVGALRRKIGSVYGGFGILDSLNALNHVDSPRPPLAPEMKHTLIEYFRDDVLHLSTLLSTDLSHWLEA